MYCREDFVDKQKFCTNCGRKIPESEMEYNISDLFRKGHQYTDMLSILEFSFGIKMSLRTLKRKIKTYGLHRRKMLTEDTITTVARHIENKLDGTGQCFGYRSMWHSLNLEGISVPRDLVMNCLKMIDPDGVALRKRRKLKRRLYRSAGPNFTWHIDGYDKLKPYGFPIHGCIDGFSRKLIWLELVTSNNNPYIVANLYVKAIRKLNLVPTRVRADHGNENIMVAAAQTFLNSEDSFMYGSSHTNQRIESWWSFLRKNRTSYLINFFRDLVDEGSYDPGDDIQKAMAHYCFSGLIKEELYSCMEQWNSHYLRKSEYSHVHGRPELLFEVFENQGLDITSPDDIDQIQHVIDDNLTENNSEIDLEEYFEYLSTEIGLSVAKTFPEGKLNFVQLKQVVNEFSLF